jgi:hypothetical protein
VVQHDLFEHEILKVILAQRVLLEVEVVRAYRRRRRLVIREMQLRQVRVLQGILDADAVIWIIGQHLLQQVNRIVIRSLEKLFEVFAITLRQLLDEVAVLLIFDFRDQCWTRISEQLRDHVQLVLFGTSW